MRSPGLAASRVLPGKRQKKLAALSPGTTVFCAYTVTLFITSACLSFIQYPACQGSCHVKSLN